MQLSDLQGSLQGQLSLAVESSAKYLVPHLFAAFRAQHPEVSLQLVVVNHAQAVRRLSVSRDDLLIMSQPPGDQALDFFPFLTNPIIAVAPPQHPLCAREQLRLADLGAYPLLVREPGSGTRKACEEYCHQKRAHFAQTLEVGSTESQVEGAIAGLGLALLPRHAVTPGTGPGFAAANCRWRSCRCSAAGAWCTRAASTCRRWPRPSATSSVRSGRRSRHWNGASA